LCGCPKGKKEETEATRAADNHAVIKKGGKRRQRPGELPTIVQLLKKGKKEKTKAKKSCQQLCSHQKRAKKETEAKKAAI